MRCQAPRVGALPPAERRVEVAGVRLLGGRWVTPDPQYASRPHAPPVMWMGRRPEPDVARLWPALAARFPETGLWPLVLDVLDDERERPWGSGELDPAAAGDPGALAVADVLTRCWSDAFPADEEDVPAHLAPFGPTFPGIAEAVEGEGDSSAWQAALEAVGPDVAIGLVPAVRPADVLARIGWQGAINVLQDPGVLSVVLRSWEDRFGAFLTGVGFDTLTLAVTRPVRPMRIARALAAEHFALCPDTVDQGADTLERLAQSLQHQRVWTFWWD